MEDAWAYMMRGTNEREVWDPTMGNCPSTAVAHSRSNVSRKGFEYVWYYTASVHSENNRTTEQVSRERVRRRSPICMLTSLTSASLSPCSQCLKEALISEIQYHPVRAVPGSRASVERRLPKSYIFPTSLMKAALPTNHWQPPPNYKWQTAPGRTGNPMP